MKSQVLCNFFGTEVPLNAQGGGGGGGGGVELHYIWICAHLGCGFCPESESGFLEE